MARLPDSSVSDDFLEEFNFFLRGSLLDSLVENPDFLSDGLDRDLEGSLFLADESVSPLDLLVQPLAQGLAATLATVVNLALADLLASDLDDDLGATTLEVGDLGLALGLGHLCLGGEHLFLPFQFFLLDVLRLFLVHLDLHVEGAGHGLRQRFGSRTETLSDHSLVVVAMVSLMMPLVMSFVVSLVVVDLVVAMVMSPVVMTMELVMMDMMVVLVAVASVMDVDLDVPVMLAVMMAMMPVMMVYMNLSVAMMVLASVSVMAAMTSLVVVSARASMFVLSVKLLVVLLETSHQALFIDVMLMSMTDPLFDLSQAAVERSLLGHDEVCGALGQSFAQNLSSVARSSRRVALSQLSEGVRRAFVERESRSRSALGRVN